MNSIMLMQAHYPLLFKGLAATFALWISAGMMSLLLGGILGTLNSVFCSFYPMQLGIKVYVFVMRGVPLFVQVLIMYFAIPELLSINLSPMMASILALGFCSAAYVSEIVRGGIQAVSQTQWEAAHVLGFSSWQTLYSIIAPQALRIMTPSLINEYESLIKSTALLSTIGVMELTKAGQNIIARHMNPISTYFIIAALYLGISLFFNLTFVVIKKVCKKKGHA